MSKHTPGPWEVKDAETESTYLRVRGTRLGCRHKVANVLAPVPLGDNADEATETLANARLIAAAPDLLEALKAMTPQMPPVDAPCHVGVVSQERCGHCSRIAKAIAAIAKAEGA